MKPARALSVSTESRGGSTARAIAGQRNGRGDGRQPFRRSGERFVFRQARGGIASPESAIATNARAHERTGSRFRRMRTRVQRETSRGVWSVRCGRSQRAEEGVQSDERRLRSGRTTAAETAPGIEARGESEKERGRKSGGALLPIPKPLHQRRRHLREIWKVGAGVACERGAKRGKRGEPRPRGAPKPTRAKERVRGVECGHVGRPAERVGHSVVSISGGCVRRNRRERERGDARGRRKLFVESGHSAGAKRGGSAWSGESARG